MDKNRKDKTLNNILRRLPGFVAIVCLAIIVRRTGLFFTHGVRVDFYTAWAFALAIELAAVISAYWFARKPETRKWATVSIVLSIVASVLFNLGEVVRTLSGEDIVPPESNFLFLNAKYLTLIFQLFGLIYGFLPTVLATVMAAVQAKIDGVELSLTAKKSKQSYNWKKLPENEKKKLQGKSPKEIKSQFQGMSNKLAELWSKYAKKKGRRK